MHDVLLYVVQPKQNQKKGKLQFVNNTQSVNCFILC